MLQLKLVGFFLKRRRCAAVVVLVLLLVVFEDGGAGSGLAPLDADPWMLLAAVDLGSHSSLSGADSREKAELLLTISCSGIPNDAPGRI